MLTLSQMIVRLVTALLLGAVIGFERELVHKEVGIRTAMMIAAGAAIFSITALVLPSIVVNPALLAEAQALNGGFLALIANIVVGVGFLGAGIIVKNDDRVHGLTSAAVIWVTASVGVLAGLGLTKFAVVAAFLIAGSLYVLRKTNVTERVRAKKIS